MIIVFYERKLHRHSDRARITERKELNRDEISQRREWSRVASSVRTELF